MIGFSAALLLLSFLTVLPGKALPLWYAAVLATEWGHYFALLSLLLLLWTLARQRWASSLLLLLAIGLFISPSVRAHRMARHLPHEISRVFPPAFSNLPLIRPFSWGGLF